MQNIRDAGYWIAVPKAIISSQRLSARAKELYCVLLSLCDQHGKRTIYSYYGFFGMHMGNLGEDAVGKYMKELRTNGLVRWKQNGIGRPNSITLRPIPSEFQDEYLSMFT